jgi:signal transduction histidine kinase
LAIVKGFAEAHDGEVKLESTLGAGTRVTVYLPVERVRTEQLRAAG